MNTHLSFDGRCEAAFKFYEKCLGGKIQFMMRHAGTPVEEHVPAEWREKMLHARIAIGGAELMGADAPPGRYEKPSGFSVALHIDDTAEAERVFSDLSAGGTVQMPLQETFWAARFGMLVDQFGIPWMINCGNPA
jgi:PhnB protein